MAKRKTSPDRPCRWFGELLAYVQKSRFQSDRFKGQKDHLFYYDCSNSPNRFFKRLFFPEKRRRVMKKFLSILCLSLTFAANARALTCVNGFELKGDPEVSGSLYCDYKGGSHSLPACPTIGLDTDKYYSVMKGECVDCPDHYAKCYLSKYSDWYESLSGTDCAIEFSYCKTCNMKNCTACQSGYELRSGRCFATCPANCSACSSSSTCTACSYGYTLENGKCVQDFNCPANCETCAVTGACKKCVSGYKVSGGLCVVDPDAAEAADTNTISGKCPPGTTKSADGCCCMPN